MTVVVRAPLGGRVVGLPAVPDPVFAEAVVGAGTAVDPDPEATVAVAPIAGRLVKLHPHAFVVDDGAGHAVLVHLGIDTVQLAGAGFDLLAEEGASVAAGAPVVRWDPAAVAAGGRSPVCPVVALGRPYDDLGGLAAGVVAAGDPLFSWGEPAEAAALGDPVATRTVTVADGVGLHARPAAVFVQAVAATGLPVTIAREGGDPVDARSILGVLALDVRGGDTVVLRAGGAGAAQALDALAALLAAPAEVPADATHV